LHHDSTVTRPAERKAPDFPDVVDFGREICGDLTAAESREWLVTNGIGGYAFGTVAGHHTRCYHGLLIAALEPPGGRVQLLAKLDETARYASRTYELSTNRWADGSLRPEGYRNIERFHLEGTTPVWTFALADALLEKRIFMESGANTTYVLYRLVRASAPVELSIKALASQCQEHCVMQGVTQPMEVAPVGRGLRVVASKGAPPLYILSDSATGSSAMNWYRNFDLAAERARGLPDRADYFFAGEFRALILPGGSLTMVASTSEARSLSGEDAFARRQRESARLLDQFSGANNVDSASTPAAIRQLVLAPDQFIAARSVEGAPDTKTILAGYPWFSDWGRDAMVALPGLCLATGRAPLARSILLSCAHYVSGGMLPNQFPRPGVAALYNSVDAALWYFDAIRQYYEATSDGALLEELFPVLDGIVDAHVRGTRYQIHIDPADGLLFAGEPGVQLTWMDAKIGDRVVTPRIGKPVEVNALWLNAVATMGKFARALGRDAARYEELTEKARAGFARFWDPERQFCFDVIDASGIPGGNDASLRPNQIFAVSLPETALTAEQQRAVVDVCARELLTSFGLRSLAPDDSSYRGHYGGSPEERDNAYHQGTVWGWLLGPFALAHLRVYRNPAEALSFLEPMLEHIKAAGLGTLSEIFDGDPPFAPNGCVAQAWTVGETLRAWKTITAAHANGNDLR
jgi:predicted glycogen debranching enzyme